MRNIYLSAGHSNAPGKDRGATIGSLTEGDLAVRVRSMLSAAIQELGGTVVTDDPSLVTIETVRNWRHKVLPNDIALDIHFNYASDKKVRGVLSIVPDKPSSLELAIAKKLSDIVHETDGTPESGHAGIMYEHESNRGQLAWMTMNCETVLLECEFISNSVALQSFLTALPSITAKIATYLVALQKQ